MTSQHSESWEAAVRWLIEQPDKQDLVRACYYDRPIAQAAVRYRNSDEWRAVRALLPPHPGTVLDVGAGHGISSVALAADGWRTIAVEPDPSELVGIGSIRSLSAAMGLEVHAVRAYAEELPFAAETFDAIHARQVLHHARNLARLAHELFRVIAPGGILVATREHVISHPRQLPAFLQRHPLQHMYGGENAFTLKEYRDALTNAGFHIDLELGPFDSPINYAPHTLETLQLELATRLRARGLKSLVRTLFHRSCAHHTLRLMSLLDRRPGRLFSFIAHRPSRPQ